MSTDLPASPCVRLRIHEAIAVLTLDNPPVNALGWAVRDGLLQGLRNAEAHPAVHALVIVGAGKAFIAGADIREFGQPPRDPWLPAVCNAIEACTKPVVAAIHGPALGGGLEIALACHARIAAPNAKLGLPEVQLGLLPGAGGTQRASRLIGAAAALDLMLSGRHVSAPEALRLGLIDHITTMAEDLSAHMQAEGIAWARHLLAERTPPRRTGEQAEALADRAANQAAIDAAKAQASKARGLFSPLQIVACVQDALDLPMAEGLIKERERFAACLASPQRAGLIHAFFSERGTAKVPEAQQGTPRPVQHVGVIGGGTMGAGIAVSLLDAGLRVTLIERDDTALQAGLGRIAKVYEGQVAKGKLSAEAQAEKLGRLSLATAYAALADADLVIEAVFEDLAVKQAVFAQLQAVCKPGAVLATNTSYLDIDAIAASTTRPQDVIGLHFFSPANIMKLLEIVVPAQVSPDVVATAFELAKRLKKVPVRAGVCDGFIGNRILAVYRTAADHMLEDGASPYDIDRMVKAFGFPMGPYEMSDLAGGDIGWATRKRRAATRDPKARYVQIADRLCERGWFGQKTGRGWYVYEAGSRQGQEDPEVLAIVEAERQRAGITPRAFSTDELERRYLAAMVNEAAKVVAEGIALRPLDVDVTLLYGYGFPRHKGGPLHHADQLGLARILADIRTFAEADPLFWRPAPLLEQLVAEGRQFADLNKI